MNVYSNLPSHRRNLADLAFVERSVSFMYCSPVYKSYITVSFQLGNLQKKWQHHEQNNFVMKECIRFSKLMLYLW